MNPNFIEPLKAFLEEEKPVFSDELFDEFFNWSYRLESQFSLNDAIEEINFDSLNQTIQK